MALELRGPSTAALSASYARKAKQWRLPLATPAATFLPVMSSPPTKTYHGPGGATPLTPTPTSVAYNSTLITGLGVVPADDSGNQYRSNGANSIGSANVWAVEFDYYGTDVVIGFRINNTLATTWTFVDGAPITAAPETPQGVTLTSGSTYRQRLVFGSAAHRRIRVYLNGASFRFVEHPKASAVMPTAEPSVASVWYGDSFVQGGNGVDGVTSCASTAGRLLGWETYNAGQGGTGYVAAGTGNNRAFTDSGRIAAAAAANPDAVVIFGSVNDDSQSGVGTAATSLFAAFATSLPNAKLIVIGPPPTSATASASANRIAARDAVKSAAQTASNVLGFIDPLAEGWLTGTGTASAPASDGNRDTFLSSDSVHLTQAGHDYFGRRLAERIATLLNTA